MEAFSKTYLAIRTSKAAYIRAAKATEVLKKLVKKGLTITDDSSVDNITDYDNESYCDYIFSLCQATEELMNAVEGLKGKYSFDGCSLVSRLSVFWHKFFTEFGKQEDGVILTDSRTKDIVTFVLRNNISTSLPFVKYHIDMGFNKLKAHKEAWLRSPLKTQSD